MELSGTVHLCSTWCWPGQLEGWGLESTEGAFTLWSGCWSWLSAETFCSCGQNTFPRLPSLVAAWRPGSRASGFHGCLQMDRQTEALSQHHWLCSPCEKLVTEGSAYSEGEKFGSPTCKGGVRKDLWACTKAIIPPVKEFVESWTWIWWSLYVYLPVHRGNTTGRQMWQITRWRNNK